MTCVKLFLVKIGKKFLIQDKKSTIEAYFYFKIKLNFVVKKLD